MYLIIVILWCTMNCRCWTVRNHIIWALCVKGPESRVWNSWFLHHGNASCYTECVYSGMFPKYRIITLFNYCIYLIWLPFSYSANKRPIVRRCFNWTGFKSHEGDTFKKHWRNTTWATLLDVSPNTSCDSVNNRILFLLLS